MRKFKVLDCPQVKVVRGSKRVKTDDGWTSVAFVREVKAGEEGWWPGAYGHEKIKSGDILDIDGHLADKAAANPAFEEVFDVPEKRKPGRPRKVKESVKDAA